MTTHAQIISALQALVPTAAWGLTGDDMAAIQWFDQTVAQPTAAAINAEIARQASVGAPVPQAVTNMQAKVALSRAGLLTNATTWINTQSAEDQLIWNSTPVFSRNSPLLLAAATALNMDATAVDKLFILAATINP